MTTEKILSLVAKYRIQFEKRGIPKIRMDSRRTLGSLPPTQLLAHAHYLLDGLAEYAQDPEKKGKTGRHLASVQMILSFAGWYTLQDLMNHNRPDA